MLCFLGVNAVDCEVDDLADFLRDAVGAAVVDNPVAGTLRDARLAELVADEGGIEEVFSNEFAECVADLVFRPRDDGRMRDGDVQRGAEQGSDGEPGGEGADHAGFASCADVADPGAWVALVFKPAHSHIDEGRDDQ